MSRTRTYAGCTLNNPTEDEKNAILNLEEDLFRWASFAIEEGESGTTHIQAAWSLKNAKTFSAMKSALSSSRWHLEEIRGTHFEAYQYTLKGQQSKEEWNAEKWGGENFGVNYDCLRTIGEAPQEEAKNKNQWDDIRQMIEEGLSDYEIAQVYPQEAIRCKTAIRGYRLMFEKMHADWREVDVWYIWGATGTGKTRSITQKYGYPNVFRVTDYSKGAFDMYDGQDVILFEEFRSSFRLEQMLNYLDGHPVELECRYANQLLKATKIFIVTNIPLDEQYHNFHNGCESEGQANSWKAFCRRISGIIEVREGEVLTQDMLPLLSAEEE